MITIPGRQAAVLILCCLALIATLTAPAAGTGELSSYPNELPNLKFYDRYLKPLRPYISDKAAVVRILGSDQGKELDTWRIRPFFVAQDERSTVQPDLVGRLAEIEITPKHRLSMFGMNFPKAFVYGGGSVSEINVSCDVYSDSSGLQYWILSENSKVGKKGDLLRIVYGHSEELDKR